MPVTRDEHTAVLYEGNQMVIFGGFVDGGERTNQTYIYHIKESRWEVLSPSKSSPRAVAGHSAVIY